MTSARRYYSFTHYVNITSRDAVRVAQSPDEMVRVGRRATWTIRRSIAAGRRQVVLDQCQFTDGRSAERVVAVRPRRARARLRARAAA